MDNNNLVQQFLTQINNAIDYKLNNLTQIKSAIVHSVNQNETVNVFIPPDKTVYHNIQNQSIYRDIQVGDCVKVIVENGNLSNMWFVGGFGLTNSILKKEELLAKMANMETVESTIDRAISSIINMIYPIGSVYISVSKASPEVLFGGKWEQIHNSFLLSADSEYYMWKRVE